MDAVTSPTPTIQAMLDEAERATTKEARDGK